MFGDHGFYMALVFNLSESVQEKTERLMQYLATQYIEKHREEAIKDIVSFVYGDKEGK
jgi:hypothetical protein